MASSINTSNYEKDGRPFYLEEVKIKEPNHEIKFEKVMVEPTEGITKIQQKGIISGHYSYGVTNANLVSIDDNESEAATEHLNDTIDALRASSGNANFRSKNSKKVKRKVSNASQNTSNLVKDFDFNSDHESVDSDCSKFGENPCVIEDFVRNFLLRSNMFRTLEAFQSEWFENKNSNSVDLSVVEAGLVPNVYWRGIL